MTLDSLFALIGLGLAVLALLPSSRQSVVFLKLRGYDWLLIALGLLIAAALLLAEEIHQLVALPARFLTLGKHASLATLGIVLAIACWLWYRISRGSIPAKRTLQLARSIEVKLLAGEPHTAVELLREGAIVLKVKPTGSMPCRLLCWSSRRLENRDRTRSGLPESPADLLTETLQSSSVLKYSLLTRLINRMAVRSVSLRTNAQRRAAERLYRNSGLAAAVSTYDPMLCFDLFDSQSADGYSWFNNCLRAHFCDTEGALAQELNLWEENPSAITSEDQEDLPILAWLFADSERAESHAAWQPIGDATIEALQQYAIDSASSPYNMPMMNFYERGKCVDKVYLAIVYFDAMVVSALSQGVRWHMFLYYYQYAAREIVPAVIARDESGREWENRYEYLLYSMISRAARWVREAARLPETNPHSAGGLEPHDISNDNIPNCAIDAITQILREVVMAGNVRQGYKQYLANAAFGLYRDLCTEGQSNGRATTLLRCLRTGGHWAGSNAEWTEQLQMLWAKHDKVPYQQEDRARLQRELFGEQND